MTTPATSPPAPTAIILWILWAAILGGLFMIHQFIAPKAMLTEEAVQQTYSFFSLIGLGLALASLAIRLLVIPRIRHLQQAMVAMLIGLALAEGIGILAMFAVPTTQVVERTMMFSLSVACVLVAAPIYAKRLVTTSPPPHP